MSHTEIETDSPFHAGEREAQIRAGVGDVAKWVGGFIRDYLPEQHRQFHTAQPFLILAGGDAEGRTWITLLDGPEGFARSPDPRHLTLETRLDRSDPLAARFAGAPSEAPSAQGSGAEGADIGVLGIELATRRRNRFSGRIRPTPEGYSIDVRQSFGNCPQYIHERAWSRVAARPAPEARHGTALTVAQIARIRAADTMFIGSGHQGRAGAASNGYDASHRGGAPGFVRVLDGTHLQIPDYAGNNFFNTIGNLLSDPRVGLLFVDFETGGLMHITGRATIDWSPSGTHDPEAFRLINVEIDEVRDRPDATGLRWARQDHLLRQLKLVQKDRECEAITSFYLAPADGRPLEPFKAGQHLPVELRIPGHSAAAKRSYSLSGAPGTDGHYRLSVKREDRGLVSRYLHDRLQVGSLIDVGTPAGDFVIPEGEDPLVLVSAGVGLTPMLSMLHAVAAEKTSARSVWFVHGARNGRHHALGAEVAALVNSADNLQQRVFYSSPLPNEERGKDYDVEGRITVADLLALKAGPQAQYLLCGPSGFVADLRNGLEAVDVDATRIHFETFGPAG